MESKKIYTTLTFQKLQIDSLTIIPSSVFVKKEDGTAINEFLIQNTNILFDSIFYAKNKNSPIIIVYKTYSKNFETWLSSQPKSFKVQEKAFTLSSKTEATTINENNINYNGSLSRGIAVGNAQDLSLNSAFNLNIQGNIGKGIQLNAAMSDANIPIQAEGNTQYLRDFDRVYISIKKDSHEVVAGDIPIAFKGHHFLTYQKKSKGIKLSSASHISNINLETHANLSIASGKNIRQSLKVSEGNQGPYRLQSNAQEAYIIILSGTERVYLDGKLLTRGANQDYIIDYNRAEITFTPSVRIYETARVIVEFEYRASNYLRTQYNAGLSAQFKKTRLSIDYYSEQDSKGISGTGLLNEQSVSRLKNAPINSASILIDGTTAYEFTPQQTNRSAVLYEKIKVQPPDDTISYILQYSRDTSLTLYHATFIDRGENNGRYILDSLSNTNGRIYKYVGKGQGRYDPLIQLTPPQKNAYVALTIDQSITENQNISASFLTNRFAKNRFGAGESPASNAAYIAYHLQHKIDSIRDLTLIVDGEWTQSGFNIIERYRSAEFQRDWGVDSLYVSDEILSRTRLYYRASKTNDYFYDLALFNQKNRSNGHSHTVGFNIKQGRLRIQNKTLYRNSKTLLSRGHFFRPWAQAKYTLWPAKKIDFTTSYQRESNKSKLLTSDSLDKRSTGFDEYKCSVHQDINKDLNWKISYLNRVQYTPYLGVMTHSSSSQEYMLQGQYTASKKIMVNYRMGYRTFTVNKTVRSGKNENNLLGGLYIQLFDRSKYIYGNIGYETSGGNAPKLEYYYEEVLKGQGNYIYIGNSDSTLVLSQFRYAPELGTANYIRIPIFNNEFISTQNSRFNAEFIIDLSKHTSKKKYWWKNVVLQNTFSFSNSLQPGGEEASYSKFNVFSKRKNVIQYHATQRSALYYNRTNPKNTFSVIYSGRQTFTTQTNGYLRSDISEIQTVYRQRLREGLDTYLGVERSTKVSDFQRSNDQNYNVLIWQFSPEIKYRHSQYFGTGLKYIMQQRQQRIQNNTNAAIHGIEGEITLRGFKLYNITSSIRYDKVSTSKALNGIQEFDLLEGLKKGSNWLVNIGIQRKLNKSTELGINTMIRKNGTTKAVQSVQAQVRAIF